MSYRSVVRVPRRRRSSADLCCLLACLLSACRLGGAGRELILEDAGTKRDATASAPSSAPSGADASAHDPAPAGGSSAVPASVPAAGVSGRSPAAVSGGAAGSAGTKSGAPTTTTAAAGAGSPMTDDAGAMAGTDLATCSFNFAACVTLDPLGFLDCATQAGPNCPELLFGGDAGQAPSPACSMQEATCLMNNPTQVDMCMAMLATCTL